MAKICKLLITSNKYLAANCPMDTLTILNLTKMLRTFAFKNETPSATPGVMFTEQFNGVVKFPDPKNAENEEPVLLFLFRDGVLCQIAPASVGVNEWQKFEQRCIHEATCGIQITNSQNVQ